MWIKLNLWKKKKDIKREIKEISYEDTNLNDFFIIEEKRKKEFQEGHINGAINIPLFSIKKNIYKINKNQKILVYCQSGARSQKALVILKELGFENAYNLKGGLDNI